MTRHLRILSLMPVIAGLLVGQTKQQPGSMRGQVTLAGTQDPAPFLNVVVVGTAYGATTNEQGQFVISGLFPGTYELRVSGIGYAAVAKKNIVVSSAATTDILIQVDQTSVQFAEVQVNANVNKIDPARPVSTQRLSNADLESTVSGWDDVFRSLSSLPGIAPANIERNDLIVRGGAPSENLFVVDNIELPTISHFATQGAGGGSSTIIPLDCIDRVTFSSGGFGVQYGDKLSSSMSLALREGDREHTVFKGAVSATQYGVGFEGPLSPKVTYLLEARRSYLDLVFKAYNMSFAPEFSDVLGKVSIRLSSTDRVDLLAVAKSDRTHLYNDTEDHRSENADIVFGNQAAIVSGITWKHFSENAYTLLTFAHSYSTYQYFQVLADQSNGFNDNSSEIESSISFDAVTAVSASTDLMIGVRGKNASFRDDLDLRNVPWFMRINRDLTRIQRSIDTAAIKLAAYAQLSQALGNVQVNAGLRADYFDLIKNGLVVAPRLSVIVHLSPVTDVTGSIGRYYQSPAYKWMANSYNRNLLYAGANQVVVGVAHHLSDQWSISLEGYNKEYFDYPSSKEAPVLTMFNAGSGAFDFKDFGLDSLLSTGKGSSKGIELFVQKRGLDSLVSGVLSVSYSWTRFAPADGVMRPADHDQRWIVNLALTVFVTPVTELGARFRLYTGHPYTPPDIAAFGTLEEYYSSYNAGRVGLNHNLDVRITRRWQLGRIALETFLDIQNVYNRKPLDTPRFDYGKGEYTEARTIGIVPSVGLTAKF